MNDDLNIIEEWHKDFYGASTIKMDTGGIGSGFLSYIHNENEKVTYMISFFVLKKDRGNGVGEILFNALKKECINLKQKKIILPVQLRLKDVHRVIKKYFDLGFRPMAVQNNPDEFWLELGIGG